MSSSAHNYPAIALTEGRATVSVEEVANVLGIGRRMAYRAIRNGQLPSRRLGRRIVMPVPILLDWLGASADRAPFRTAGRPCRSAQ